MTENLHNCDSIAGRDPLEELDTSIDFNDKLITWEESQAPMVDMSTSTKDSASHHQEK